MSGSDNNTLTNNVAEGPGAGFALGNDTHNNTLDGNTAIGTSGTSSWGGSVGFTVHGDASNLSSGNAFTSNSAFGTVTGFVDVTSGSGTAGTDNTYSQNKCIGTNFASNPTGLCNPSGSFTDDDDSIFEFDIEWMAAEGITKGCNPPVNDRFCPDSSVTRGQMAAFLVRALGLTDGLDDPFIDDDDSVFEADIEKLAAAGITKGCNPPTNDRFCPDSKVTREVMAAFLVRALGYSDPGAGDLFTDDDLSIFEADIDRLATAGVTKGCNPPTNDRFCPTGYVTRGQMAAFLHRALG
jgi:parallel beta-helix repeat protein